MPRSRHFFPIENPRLSQRQTFKKYLHAREEGRKHTETILRCMLNFRGSTTFAKNHCELLQFQVGEEREVRV